jgi:hypothetical protein
MVDKQERDSGFLQSGETGPGENEATEAKGSGMGFLLLMLSAPTPTPTPAASQRRRSSWGLGQGYVAEAGQGELRGDEFFITVNIPSKGRTTVLGFLFL